MKKLLKFLIGFAVLFLAVIFITPFFSDSDENNDKPVNNHEIEQNEEEQEIHTYNKKTTKTYTDNEIKTTETAKNSVPEFSVFPDNTSLILSPGEEYEINIFSKDDINKEDIIVEYDTAVISVDFKEKADSRLYYNINTVSSGDAEVKITGLKDRQINGDDAKEKILNIKVLTDDEAKIVYITPYGEKYHFSKRCAGENASEMRLYDAEKILSPCKKCTR